MAINLPPIDEDGADHEPITGWVEFNIMPKIEEVIVDAKLVSAVAKADPFKQVHMPDFDFKVESEYDPINMGMKFKFTLLESAKFVSFVPDVSMAAIKTKWDALEVASNCASVAVEPLSQYFMKVVNSVIEPPD